MLNITIIASIIAALVLMIGLYYFLQSSVSLWFKARINGAKVDLFDLAFMRLQKVKPAKLAKIVKLIIEAHKAGVHIDTGKIGGHLLAGGDVERIIKAVTTAEQAKLGISFERISAIELAGRDVLEAINMSVSPPIVETPEVSSVAKDGVQLRIKCSVTIRPDFNNFLGNPGKATILARVGEGIVSVIGSAENHQEVVSNPDMISEFIMGQDRNLDDEADIHQDTAFKIISIDVATLKVGEDLAAGLRARQAEADEQVAQARKAAELADMITEKKHIEAKIHESEAERLKAEIQVPKAIATAIAKKTLKVKDYFQIKNLIADTRMREAFATSGKPPEHE